MAKYSYELKKKVVDEYLAGVGGYNYIAKKYGVSCHSIVERWVASYKACGNEGLLRSRKNINYTFEYKLRVVELYLTTEVSYQELSDLEKINNPSLISNWVMSFRRDGPQGLRPKKKGRKLTMDIKDTTSKSEKIDISEPVNISELQQLRDEVLHLKIENAYLKELRRLRLQDQQLLKEQQESYIASEDHSN